jgi:hypothetical protein
MDSLATPSFHDGRLAALIAFAAGLESVDAGCWLG